MEAKWFEVTGPSDHQGAVTAVKCLVIGDRVVGGSNHGEGWADLRKRYQFKGHFVRELS